MYRQSLKKLFLPNEFVSILLVLIIYVSCIVNWILSVKIFNNIVQYRGHLIVCQPMKRVQWHRLVSESHVIRISQLVKIWITSEVDHRRRTTHDDKCIISWCRQILTYHISTDKSLTVLPACNIKYEKSVQSWISDLCNSLDRVTSIRGRQYHDRCCNGMWG